MNRSYSELERLQTFEERYDYLKLNGEVGRSTFGFDRYINQGFYTSSEWRTTRDRVIVRDYGCDLGIPGYEIHTELLVHHINPIALENIIHGEDWIFDPEYLITTTKRTHNAIHFGNDHAYPRIVTARTPNDTRLWGTLATNERD